MFDEIFIKKMNQSLQNADLVSMLIESEKSNSDYRRRLIVRIINYLISTRDFDGFNYYLNNYHEIFPNSYLRNKGLTKEESTDTIYENFIKNGFLFHITPSYNVDEIMKHGLKTLTDRCDTNIYQKSLEVNKVYNTIKRRNEGLFSLTSLVSIPGYVELEEERFNSVYLSSNLDYILKTYGLSSELSNYFLRDLFYAFKGKEKYEKMTKQEIREEIISMMQSSKATIYEQEIDLILEYFNQIYHEKEGTRNTEQAILMIPNSIIKGDEKFEFLYRNEKIKLPVETIIELDKGEVINHGSISPENILAITPNDDKTLRLVRKNK